LAHILGASNIILLGMDCCFEEDKKRYNEFLGQPSDNIYKEVFKKHLSNNTPICGAFQSTWKKIKIKNPKVNILNASGGVLECFPKISISEALKYV
jgi:hypothetical protein